MPDALETAKEQASKLLPVCADEAETHTGRMKVLFYATRIIEACEPKKSIVRQVHAPSGPAGASQSTGGVP